MDDKYSIALAKAEKWLGSNIGNNTKSDIRNLINNPKELTEAFYENMEFGTGGLRGIMGTGTNRMNVYTVKMASQGLCNYIKKVNPALSSLSVVIAYDSRNNSREFAGAAADVFASNGFITYLFESLRPTPELSYAVRKLNCVSGVVITASHNPKEYNGYKAYWSDGGQLVPPHDKNIIAEVNDINSVDDVKTGKNSELISMLGKEFDELYLDEIVKSSLSPGIVAEYHDLKIVYTPIHGSGVRLVPEVLKKFGFTGVHLVESQCVPDGNFPTVHSPNPEEKAAMNLALQLALTIDAELVMATDPDCDRVGIAVKNPDNEFILLNGNQTAALLTYYMLSTLQKRGLLKGNEFIVKTIVTSELIAAIANSFNVEYYDVLTGFKYIAEKIKENEGKKKYICGGEESYGFLVGDFVRDKDAVSACAIIAECAAWCKSQGKTLYRVLLDIYLKYGYYKESLASVTKKGMDGQTEIKNMMKKFRFSPPEFIAGSKVVVIKDYSILINHNITTGEKSTIELVKSDVLQFITEDGTIVSIRPSGTEPKIKFYIGVKDTLRSLDDFKETDSKLNSKIKRISNELELI